MDKNRRGTRLGMPYDTRRPTAERVRRRMWNPDDHRVFVPKAFGWGYSINFAAAARLLGIRR